MAKKPKQAKSRSGGAGKKKAEKKKAAKPRAKKPKQQRLLDDMPKDRILDRLCETIAEAREQANELRTTEKAAMAQALARMQNENLTQYTAHGIELLRVEGQDKLRVRLVDSDAGGEDPGEDVEEVELPEGDQDGDDTGDE